MFFDLPTADKSQPGQAFHLTAADIPAYETAEGARIRVVVGSEQDVMSPLQITTQIRLLDVTLPAQQTISHEIAEHESAFLITITGSGSATQASNLFHEQDAVLFDGEGTQISIEAGSEGLQYILCISQTPEA